MVEFEITRGLKGDVGHRGAFISGSIDSTRSRMGGTPRVRLLNAFRYRMVTALAAMRTSRSCAIQGDASDMTSKAAAAPSEAYSRCRVPHAWPARCQPVEAGRLLWPVD